MPQRKQDGGPALKEYRRKRDFGRTREPRDPVHSQPESVKSGKRIGELTQGKQTPGQFTLRTVPTRLRGAGRAGDPWAGLARRRPGLGRAQESLRRLAA